MSMPLRKVPPGTRFMLLRTRQHYTLVEVRLDQGNRVRRVVQLEGGNRQATLHGSCLVKRVACAEVVGR